MKRFLRLAGTVVAGATIATVAGGMGMAQAATPTPPPPVKTKPLPPPVFVPPHIIAANQLVRILRPEPAGTLTLLPQPKPIKVGDVLVVNPATGPQQILKVTAVSAAGKNVTVSTTPTSAINAVGPGTFSAHAGLGPNAVIRLANGTIVKPSSATSHTFSFSESVKCGTGTVLASGSLDIDPSLEAGLSIGLEDVVVPYVESANVTVGLTEDASFNLQAQSPSSLTPSTCTGSAVLGSVQLPFSIEGIGGSVTLALTADAKASITGTSSFSIHQHFAGSAGVSYTSAGGWHSFGTASESGTHSLTGPGALSGEVGLTGRASLTVLDGVLSGDLAVRGDGGISLSPGQQPAWKLYAGLALTGGVNLNYGLGSIGYNGTLWSDEWTLLTPPAFTSFDLPTAHPGLPYSAHLSAAYGAAPYAFSSFGLPAGLHLSPTTGVITGSLPAGSASRTDDFIAYVTDANGFTDEEFMFLPVAPLQIVGVGGTRTLNGATFFYQPLSATGADGPVTWTVTGGLPVGVSLRNGVLSGELGTAGTYAFTVRATDASGATTAASEEIVVNKPVVCNGKVCTINR